MIGPQQIWAGVMPVGPSGVALNSSYKTRNSNEYRLELGNAIGEGGLGQGRTRARLRAD